jgi:signal transduction histidine kinase
VVRVALTAYVVVYAAVTYSGMLEGVALLWWSDMAWTIISLAAGIKCIQTARSQRRPGESRAWYAFGVAALLWFCGMLVWDYMELVGGMATPYPSVADLLFTGFALAFMVGIFHYRDTRSARYTGYIQLGNLGIIVCTVIIIASIILYPQIRQSGESYLYIGFAIAYAVVFMSAFLFGLFNYWFYVWNGNRRVFPVLLTALFIHAVADTLYGFELLGKSYSAENYLNVFWIIAFAVQYWAAVEQDSLNAEREPDAGAASKQDGIRNFEGIAPSLSLLSVLLTLWIFGRDIDYGLLKFVFAVALVLMVFLVVREWSMSRSLTAARTNLEQEVRQRTLELTQTNRELEAYSYSIAHDLRSPLRAVTGFSQILLTDTAARLNEEEQDYLRRIARAGNSMARLIDEILELSRVSRVDMQTGIVDIGELSGSIAARLADSEPERKVKWSIQPHMQVAGDPQLLALVMENLIGNAFKYTAHEPRARIEIGVGRRNGERVHFVRDNGVGFDMAYYDKLFEPFQRLHRNDDFPGTGVGLATVARVVERHGGRIWAEGEPGKGATFYIVLPPP